MKVLQGEGGTRGGGGGGGSNVGGGGGMSSNSHLTPPRGGESLLLASEEYRKEVRAEERRKAQEEARTLVTEREKELEMRQQELVFKLEQKLRAIGDAKPQHDHEDDDNDQHREEERKTRGGWSRPMEPLADNEVLVFTAVMTHFQRVVDMAESMTAMRRLGTAAGFYRLIIIDNTGCAFRHLPNERKPGNTTGVKYVHVNQADLSANLDCETWDASVERLRLEHNTWVYVPFLGTLNFGQSNNFAQRWTRMVNRSRYVWAHADIIPQLQDLQNVVAVALKWDDPFCVIWTWYDAFAVLDAMPLADRVGDWDENLWYYGENDFYDRCRRAGLPIGLLNHTVVHDKSTTLKKRKELHKTEHMHIESSDYKPYFDRKTSYFSEIAFPAARFSIKEPSFSVEGAETIFRFPGELTEDFNIGKRMWMDRRFPELTNVTLFAGDIFHFAVVSHNDTDVRNMFRYEKPALTFYGRPHATFRALWDNEPRRRAWLSALSMVVAFALQEV